MNIRPAAVAGMFYEANANDLQIHVNHLLESASPSAQADASALIVPHAGYVYSGATAAMAYKTLESRAAIINRVVLFGPAHRVYLNGMAIPSVESFNTPLGDIPLDRNSLDAIRNMPGVVVSDEAHEQEHCLEVQLPFLQTVLEQFSLVPVVVGDCRSDIVADVVDTLWGGDETLVVISSDLSHFHSYQQARQIDEHTCQRILNKESELSGEEACGARAINGLMRSRHCQSLVVSLIDACNSGDTAGNHDRVVGYGAFVLH